MGMPITCAKCSMCHRARAEVRLILGSLDVRDVCRPCGRRVWRVRSGEGVVHVLLSDLVEPVAP